MVMARVATRPAPGRISSPGRCSRVSSVVAPQCNADQRNVTTDRTAAPATNGATRRLMISTVVREPLARGETRVAVESGAEAVPTRNTPESVGARLAFASPGYQ